MDTQAHTFEGPWLPNIHRHYCPVRSTVFLETPGKAWCRNQIWFWFILLVPSHWERQHPLLKPRTTNPGFASVLFLWKSETRRKVQLWGLPALWECGPAPEHRLNVSGAHQRLGRNFNLLYPFPRVQKRGSHGQGWAGSSCCSAGSCPATKDARSITPAPLNCSVFFHHKVREDNSESCMYCALRPLAEKRNKKYRRICIILHIKYRGGTHDLLALFCWNPASGSVTQTSILMEREK